MPDDLPQPAKLWLFSAPVDLAVFAGSAAVSLVLLAIGWQFGLLESDSPDWTWITTVLLVDVAHVWATGFRVYFDRAELSNRPYLYLAVPIVGYAVGVALYSEDALLFWRVLAYLAVFHFVRQQYGWVVLYRAKLGERDKLGFYIDATAIYLATIYPLVYWHANLPRGFDWFVPNDFAQLPAFVVHVFQPAYWLALALYFAKSLYLWRFKNFVSPGKDIVVLTTALCWHLGIITFNSDFAFTVTNVIIHGVPYFAVVYWYARKRREAGGKVYNWLSGNLVNFLLLLWVVAYAEELLWHRGVWHERGWLFGAKWDLESVKLWTVPLLAVPQLTHYILDGFIWRRRSNPNLRLAE